MTLRCQRKKATGRRESWVQIVPAPRSVASSMSRCLRTGRASSEHGASACSQCPRFLPQRLAGLPPPLFRGQLCLLFLGGDFPWPLYPVSSPLHFVTIRVSSSEDSGRACLGMSGSLSLYFLVSDPRATTCLRTRLILFKLQGDRPPPSHDS